jgi:hypothetical protein
MPTNFHLGATGTKTEHRTDRKAQSKINSLSYATIKVMLREEILRTCQVLRCFSDLKRIAVSYSDTLVPPKCRLPIPEDFSPSKIKGNYVNRISSGVFYVSSSS